MIFDVDIPPLQRENLGDPESSGRGDQNKRTQHQPQLVDDGEGLSRSQNDRFEVAGCGLADGAVATVDAVSLTYDALGRAVEQARGSSVAYYRQADWLGSSRLATTPTAPTTVYADTEYAPYGESYGVTGTLDLNFTGQNQDTVPSSTSGLYDFLFREYNPQHGRWISPDPAGFAAVNLVAPQTWNRYAYQ